MSLGNIKSNECCFVAVAMEIDLTIGNNIVIYSVLGDTLTLSFDSVRIAAKAFDTIWFYLVKDGYCDVTKFNEEGECLNGFLH